MLYWLLSLCLVQPPSSEGWKYVVPARDDAFHHPALRLLPLTNTKPADLEEEVTYQGATRRYGQFHFGNALSTRICVVLDVHSDGKVDLYIDANRNRLIEANERQPVGDEWEVPLDAVITEKTAQARYPRKVLFRYGKTTKTLSYATCGYMEGSVQTEDDTLPARRVDADGNGLFADAQDRLWINLTLAQEWDAVQHQFPFAPMITLRDQRYIVQADAVGERLALKPVFGVGKLSIAPPNITGGAKVVALSATVTSKDGTLATFTSLEKPLLLPPGEYACVSLRMSLQKDNAIWSYLFTTVDSGRLSWKKLEKDQELKLDVVGKPHLEAALGTSDIKPGSDFYVQPQLWTGTGLLINIVYMGLDQPMVGNVESAKIVLQDQTTTLASSASGFA
ncbi:MAG: hypothetical protein QM703_11670 [Gemmatales bacterium]